jgi:hypothetical protein
MAERARASAATRVEQLRATSRLAAFVGTYDRLGLLDRRTRRYWQEELSRLNRAPGEAPPAVPSGPEELRSVVLGPNGRQEGLRIMSVELYTTRTIVRWHLVVDQALPRGDDATPDLALTDDVGTEYGPGEVFGRVSARNAEAAVSWTSFVPSVPYGATSLEIRAERAIFAIPLAP